MKFLSSRRRHKAVKPLLLVAALFLMGGLYSVAVPEQQSSADTGTSTQVEEGRQLFAVGCASCHGLNGEGSSEGPSVVGVGAASVDFQVETGRMPMAQPAEQAPQHEVTYSREEIDALAAYVASLGPGPEIPSPEQYDPAGLTAEEIAAGGELFRTNCSACHNFTGAGGALPNGKYAPALEGVTPKHIHEALRTGPQQMPVFAESTISDENVRQIIAYLETLQQEPSGGLTLGGLGPVSEGLWGWIIGIGGLSLFAVWIASKGARSK
ncbi:cytochrome bc1 complex diheme cytochrome c subunit [Auraticoccus monumenti]|uniref:Cytochrome bc1 complex cytochrome c subunit n=1 Tax=Auraticoccus monumenti TaxID=675864 RepID=A0A1G7DV89_9ACTN|nr:c-type cytochrome [Auraticoccus monumenti]SDE55106.1 menaquinol-cytochrome c reductase cytochrome c1 subunit precursor [Auraticoccus monumenti]